MPSIAQPHYPAAVHPTDASVGAVTAVTSLMENAPKKLHLPDDMADALELSCFAVRALEAGDRADSERFLHQALDTLRRRK